VLGPADEVRRGDMRVAERVFTIEDQIAFATLSGDRNPIHVDPVLARRYLFGEPVVHGIHAVLWALDGWLNEPGGTVRLHSVRANFVKPIGLETEVEARMSPEGDARVVIELTSRKSMVARVALEVQSTTSHMAIPIASGFPDQDVPRVVSDEALQVAAGSLALYLHVQAVSQMFPNVARRVHPSQVAILLATTRLVGMTCPGMHSVYSELILSADGSVGETSLLYRVTRFDKRFKLVLIDLLAPGMKGTIKAFKRPEPAAQPDYPTIMNLVERNEFAHQRALVIGGSRGLGEVVSKILCAGGARVKISYFRGEDDARRIVNEVIEHGGTIEAFRHDVLGQDQEPLKQISGDWTPTHLYYFATPFISSSTKGEFSRDLFETFCRYYVSGFMNAVSVLEGNGLTHVFYPSSVYVEEFPPHLAEYIAAKMAGETVCTFLAKTRTGLTVYRPRLPRMATDQTASMVPMDNQDPVSTMLKFLRSFRS
jgi:acyl dehydratase